MCDNWTDIIRTCLYQSPFWIEWWNAWLWWLLLLLSLILFLFSLGRMAWCATHDKVSYLSLGWIRGKKKTISRFQRAINDYRTWVFFINLIGLGIVVFGVLYYRNPHHLLHHLGVTDVWQLSPTGVTLLINYIWLLLWLEIGWLLISLLSTGIIWLDPYDFLRFTITLLDIEGACAGKITFEDEPLERKETKRCKGLYLFIKRDGCACRLTPPPDETIGDWRTFEFNLKEKCLSEKSSKDKITNGHSLRVEGTTFKFEAGWKPHFSKDNVMNGLIILLIIIGGIWLLFPQPETLWADSENKSSCFISEGATLKYGSTGWIVDLNLQIINSDRIRDKSFEFTWGRSGKLKLLEATYTPPHTLHIYFDVEQEMLKNADDWESTMSTVFPSTLLINPETVNETYIYCNCDCGPADPLKPFSETKEDTQSYQGVYNMMIKALTCSARDEKAGFRQNKLCSSYTNDSSGAHLFIIIRAQHDDQQLFKKPILQDSDWDELVKSLRERYLPDHPLNRVLIIMIGADKRPEGWNKLVERVDKISLMDVSYLNLTTPQASDQETIERFLVSDHLNLIFKLPPLLFNQEQFEGQRLTVTYPDCDPLAVPIETAPSSQTTYFWWKLIRLSLYITAFICVFFFTIWLALRLYQSNSSFREELEKKYTFPWDKNEDINNWK